MATVNTTETIGTSRIIKSPELSAISPQVFSKLTAWAKVYGEAGNIGSTGIQLTSGGTTSFPALATTSYKNSILKIRYTNAAGTNQLAYVRNNSNGNLANIWRGNASGLGGFRGLLNFGYGLDTTGSRFFAGVTASTGNLLNTINPSAAVNMFGVGFDDSDVSGSNFLIMHNDAAGTATRVDSLIARDINSYYSLLFEAPPNGSYINLEFINLSSGASSGVRTLTTNLPDAAIFLCCPRLESASAALVAAPQVDFSNFILSEY